VVLDLETVIVVVGQGQQQTVMKPSVLEVLIELVSMLPVPTAPTLPELEHVLPMLVDRLVVVVYVTSTK